MDSHATMITHPEMLPWTRRLAGCSLREFWRYAGPAFLVSVGYIDPGNWGTDIDGGARFGYHLLWVILFSKWCRRRITMLPALAILALGIDPLKALVLSQVALSLQFPFTVLPLIVFTGSKAIMGEFQNGPVTRIVASATTTVILILNGALLVLTLAN
jgi:Mn2+/Fe2+ NRAMP family transporter